MSAQRFFFFFLSSMCSIWMPFQWRQVRLAHCSMWARFRLDLVDLAEFMELMGHESQDPATHWKESAGKVMLLFLCQREKTRRDLDPKMADIAHEIIDKFHRNNAFYHTWSHLHSAINAPQNIESEESSALPTIRTRCLLMHCGSPAYMSTDASGDGRSLSDK